MNNFIFWTQSTDNKAPDIIAIAKDGQELKFEPSENIKERQHAVSRIYKIAEEKNRVDSESKITLYRRDSDFVIEAVPVERDCINREAPIIISGKLPEEWTEKWGEEVRSMTEKFASDEKVQRTFEDEILKTMEQALKDVSQKKYRENSGKDLLRELTVAVTIPLLLGVLLQTQVPLIVQQPVSKLNPQPASKTSPNTEASRQLSAELSRKPIQPPITPTIPQPAQPQVTRAILQQVIRKLILLIAGLIAINNALMVILSKLPLTSLLLNRRSLIAKN
ncbi:hypothetical protein [Planktothrix sp. FACHB-1365]|uniref:hypothetical protein n=1 Tax=Planktothrix sp. FACHB-1365 TaxID=2692855 RepID=UPI001687ADFE|nr:hypothetical protein [Planktothrix sp. FACHB-1365]MBD2483822.1 hypothetical protein [Planktothrix sp. FACHB-1365]